MPAYPVDALKAALNHLRCRPFLPATVQALAANVSAVNAELDETVIAEIPAFPDARNPDILPGFRNHGPQHTSEFLRLLGGGDIGEFDDVRTRRYHALTELLIVADCRPPQPATPQGILRPDAE